MDINFLDYKQELQRINVQKLIVTASTIIFLTSFVIVSYWGYQNIKIKFSEIELEKIDKEVLSLSNAAAEVQSMKVNIQKTSEAIKEISRVRNNQFQLLQVLEGLTLSVPNGIWLTKIIQLPFEKIANTKGMLAFINKPKNENKSEKTFLKVRGNVLRSKTDNPLTTYVKNLRKINHFKSVYLQKINLQADKNAVSFNFILYIQLA